MKKQIKLEVAQKVRDESYWQNLGITFSIPDEENFQEILDFYKREFIPDEPVLRSLDLLGGNSWIDRYVHKLVLDDIMTDSLKHPMSLVARNQEGNIVGLRLGKVYSVNDPVPWEPNFQWTITFPWAPKRLIAIGLVQLYLDMFEYGVANAFKQLNCNGKIYFGQAVCVSREIRGKGLGDELVKRTNQIAVENGCEYAYLLASAIFAKNGFKVLKEFRYEDMLDPYGKPIIWDYREHKITQLVYKKF